MCTWRGRKETLGVIREYAKRHKSVYISVNNNKILNFLKILFIYTIWNGAKKPSHATVLLRRIIVGMLNLRDRIAGFKHIIFLRRGSKQTRKLPKLLCAYSSQSNTGSS
jgi:hypothetical protein